MEISFLSKNICHWLITCLKSWKHNSKFLRPTSSTTKIPIFRLYSAFYQRSNMCRTIQQKTNSMLGNSIVHATWSVVTPYVHLPILLHFCFTWVPSKIILTPEGNSIWAPILRHKFFLDIDDDDDDLEANNRRLENLKVDTAKEVNLGLTVVYHTVLI